jgi:hypothetical protein
MGPREASGSVGLPSTYFWTAGQGEVMTLVYITSGTPDQMIRSTHFCQHNRFLNKRIVH